MLICSCFAWSVLKIPVANVLLFYSPICFDTIDEAFMTKCGHTFWWGFTCFFSHLDFFPCWILLPELSLYCFGLYRSGHVLFSPSNLMVIFIKAVTVQVTLWYFSCDMGMTSLRSNLKDLFGESNTLQLSPFSPSFTVITIIWWESSGASTVGTFTRNFDRCEKWLKSAINICHPFQWLFLYQSSTKSSFNQLVCQLETKNASGCCQSISQWQAWERA